MIKHLLSIALFLMIISTRAYSQPVQIAEAQKVARNFYFERINRIMPVEYNETGITSWEVEKFNGIDVSFIFRMSPAGYVIVSATKNIIPVLAYSFDPVEADDFLPPQFVAWTEQYKKQAEFAIINGLKPSASVEAEWGRLLTDDISVLNIVKNGKDVAPMLISTWDQGNYYNQMCPADPQGPAGHCYTGCVATAMGQLCYYFRWPDTGTGSYTYQHPDYGTISANFGETEYDWNGMTNHLSEQNPAVAELLFHLGVSVDMDYGPDGSGMWNHKAAYSLRTYFKYSPETEYLFRDSTNLDWDSVIVAHLDNGIPLYYAGWSVPNVNGHAFICDGYQGEEYFHFNWGWGGSWDGYFYIDTLTPGGSNFNLAQELVINCFPDTINYTYPLLCGGADTLYSTNGSVDDGSGPDYNYGNNTDCSWLISPQTVEDSITSIKIFFDKMDTEEGNDIVTVYDGETVSSPVLGQFSGNEIPDEIVSTGNKVLITFISNENTTAAGWFLHYFCEKPDWCSGMTDLTGEADTIDDGSGSFFYHNGTSCMWHIHPENATEITLEFQEFMTEEEKDFVKIVNGENSELLAKYSGIYNQGFLPEPVICPSGDMYIIFSTNQTVTNQGWKASYTSIATGINNYSSEAYPVRIFPNPAKDEVNISMKLTDKQNIEITLINSEGIVKREFEILNASGNLNSSVNIEELPAGIYFIIVRGETVNFTGKLIK